MRTVAPEIVKTATILRGLLFLGGVLTGAALLLATLARPKDKP
jgi:hypothetical protein